VANHLKTTFGEERLPAQRALEIFLADVQLQVKPEVLLLWSIS
jgi:hypothetical protein